MVKAAALFLSLFLAVSKSLETFPSKFSYESQLLDKMIRMELRMKQMEGRINKTQDAVDEALLTYTTTLDTKKAEVQALKETADVPLVAFFATRPQDTSLDTAQKVIMQTVVLNHGNGYDQHLGMFTAQYPGLYQFTAHICNYSGNGFYYYIMLEGNIIAESTKQNSAAHDCGASSVITQMVKGQRVWIQCASGSASTTQLYDTSYRRSSFSGVLLHM